MRSYALRFALLICAALMLASCDQITAVLKPRTAASKHILFIGNSFTDINGGIDNQLEGLAPDLQAQRIAPGGFTLENHWNGGAALATIRKGGWNYVVLQEQSQTPVIDQSKFYTYVEKFDVEARKIGARTILLMTWERPDSIRYEVTTANLAAIYSNVGTKLGVQVAPTGLAFERSHIVRPDLKLYLEDGHPTLYGTYLAACVLYATIYNASPVGNPYSDRSIAPEIKTFFQRVAAETTGF